MPVTPIELNRFEKSKIPGINAFKSPILKEMASFEIDKLA